MGDAKHPVLGRKFTKILVSKLDRITFHAIIYVMRGEKMIKEMRPTCINHGCDYQVAHSGTRWRPM